ncbi:hypothetical protein ASZ90_009363 [hydrocarbon metagenome]|uniref:Uncharacterized protein n=1 Tax=hydrocarbon metagenome TaxID=938273 RepID=A0A0W8FJ29_9ZZZZ
MYGVPSMERSTFVLPTLLVEVVGLMVRLVGRKTFRYTHDSLPSVRSMTMK